MQNILNKYTIYGRKKGKKKIKSLYKNLYKNYLFDLNTNLKNKKIIIDIGSGNGENSLYLSQKFPDSLIIASEIYEDGVVNLCNQLSINKIDKYMAILLSFFLGNLGAGRFYMGCYILGAAKIGLSIISYFIDIKLKRFFINMNNLYIGNPNNYFDEYFIKKGM